MNGRIKDIRIVDPGVGIRVAAGKRYLFACGSNSHLGTADVDLHHINDLLGGEWGATIGLTCVQDG